MILVNVYRMPCFRTFLRDGTTFKPTPRLTFGRSGIFTYFMFKAYFKIQSVTFLFCSELWNIVVLAMYLNKFIENYRSSIGL